MNVFSIPSYIRRVYVPYLRAEENEMSGNQMTRKTFIMLDVLFLLCPLLPCFLLRIACSILRRHFSTSWGSKRVLKSVLSVKFPVDWHLRVCTTWCSSSDKRLLTVDICSNKLLYAQTLSWNVFVTSKYSATVWIVSHFVLVHLGSRRRFVDLWMMMQLVEMMAVFQFVLFLFCGQDLP